MLLTYARTHNPGPAEALMADTERAAAAHPWHRGLWTVRLSQVRAELALARGDLRTACDEAAIAAAQGRAIGRRKYEALALVTRARALAGLGQTREAGVDARNGAAVARQTDDPALILQALDALLDIEGRDDALAEARALIETISSALPDQSMRLRFESSETVQRIRRLVTARRSSGPTRLTVSVGR